jgi:hypothetical protein
MKKLLFLTFSAWSLLAAGCQKVLEEPQSPQLPLMVEESLRGVVSPGTEYHYNGHFDEVRLVFAQPFSYAVSGMSYVQSYFRVHVKNLGSAPSRRVFIHYSSGGAWQDLELNLLSDHGTHSVFTGQMPPTFLRFAVRFESDAGTWWDNNEGADYAITSWTVNGDHQPGYSGGG